MTDDATVLDTLETPNALTARVGGLALQGALSLAWAGVVPTQEINGRLYLATAKLSPAEVWDLLAAAKAVLALRNDG